MQSLRLLVCVALLVAAGCEAVPPGSGSPAADEPTAADAGPDAAPPPVTCCRLSNERGELLDFKCSASPAFDVGYLEARAYRCVSTPR